MTFHRTPSLDGVAPPLTRDLDDSLLGEVITLGQACTVTGLDKKTILAAIHRGRLPAWWPGDNAQVGFRMYRRDLEAWFFSDPTRAVTPGTGSPDGPETRR